MTPFPRGWQGESGWIVLGFAVLVVLIAAGTVLIIRLNRTAGDRRPPTGQKSADPAESQAVRRLEERFARGEIDADELRLRRDLLRTRP